MKGDVIAPNMAWGGARSVLFPDPRSTSRQPGRQELRPLCPSRFPALLPRSTTLEGLQVKISGNLRVPSLCIALTVRAETEPGSMKKLFRWDNRLRNHPTALSRNTATGRVVTAISTVSAVQGLPIAAPPPPDQRRHRTRSTG